MSHVITRLHGMLKQSVRMIILMRDALCNIVLFCLSSIIHNHGCDKTEDCNVLNVLCVTIFGTLKSCVLGCYCS